MSLKHFILDITTTLDMTGPSSTPIFATAGGFELSITGTWTGTVAILRRPDSSSNWGVAQTYTENVEDSAIFQTAKTNSEYTVVSQLPAGTGSAVIRIYK